MKPSLLVEDISALNARANLADIRIRFERAIKHPSRHRDLRILENRVRHANAAETCAILRRYRVVTHGGIIALAEATRSGL